MLACGAICACILLTTCGGGKQPSDVSLQLSDRNDGSQATEELVSQSIDQTLTELEEMECPEGVDEELWVEMKDALGKALNDSCRAGIYPRRSATGMDGGGHKWPPYSGHSMLCPYKSVATPPTGEANRVDDLAILDNGDGTFTLTWHYRNLGDYDQDGTVAVEDIIPLAEHFGETYESEDISCVQAVIDGSGNGRIGIEDITPIAINFAASVHHYAIEGAAEEAGAYELVSEIAQDAGSGDGRLEYSAVIESPAALWHRVVPYDAENNPGEASNAVLRPTNEPVIYEVNPTEGYQHEECTFSATVTGAEPREYAWDFGGGASPDNSSESSPTVMLADAGEYAASLTVTNADGSASYPFTLTVSERDMWAHTWGGFRSDMTVDLMLDGQENLYVVGETNSFGGGDDVLLLKYVAEGEFLWARTWGTAVYENVAGATLREDRLRVVGHTYISGDRRDDVVFLEYDLEGNLSSSRTFGGNDYDRVHDIFVDPEGSIYLAGERYAYAGDADVLVAKFAPDLTCLWARAWGGAGDDLARGLVVNADGSVFVACNVDKLAEEDDIGLLKYSSGGELEWAVAWDSGGNEGATHIVLVGQGNLCVMGRTNGFGVGDYDILLTMWDTEGQLVAARTWGGPDSDSHALMFLDPVGGVRIFGWTRSFGPLSALMLKLDGDFDLLEAAKWSVDYTYFETMTCDYNGNLYMAGSTSSLGGHWEEVEISEQQVGGTVRSLSTDDDDLDWSEGTIEGEEDSPEGEEDTSAGSVDVLVIKNMPW